MAAVLHSSARTTPRVRAELHASQASTRALAARQYRLNPKTVAKWRARQTTHRRCRHGAARAAQHRAVLCSGDDSDHGSTGKDVA
jgi:hypothetical protein